jgi:hypothetical protein
LEAKAGRICQPVWFVSAYGASIPGNNELDAVSLWAAFLTGKVAMIYSWPPSGRMAGRELLAKRSGDQLRAAVADCRQGWLCGRSGQSGACHGLQQGAGGGFVQPRGEHDQIEAMTLADRIVLMRDGQIEQQGAPLDLFERPATTFVAGFLGSPRMSFLPGVVERSQAGDAVRLNSISMPLPPGRLAASVANGQAVLLGLRPEHITRAQGPAPAPGSVRHEALIELIQPTGSRSYATFRLGGERVMAELQAHDVSRPGERVELDINMRRASLFDSANETAI